MPTYDERTGVYSTFDAKEFQVVYAEKVIGTLKKEKEEEDNGEDHNK